MKKINWRQLLLILTAIVLITWLGTELARSLFRSYYMAEYGTSAPITHYTWFPHRLSQVTLWAAPISACVGLIVSLWVKKLMNKKRAHSQE